MGANTHLEHVAAYGYKTEAAATVITQTIPGRPGERIAIRAYSLGCGATATNAYFLQVQDTTTIGTAVASGGSTLALATALTAAYIWTAGDYLAVVQDDGTYHFSLVGAVTTSVAITLCTVVTDTIAVGQTVYQMGANADAGQYLIKLTASTGDTKELDGGIMYAAAKGYPMVCRHANDAAAAASIRYLTVDYLNV